MSADETRTISGAGLDPAPSATGHGAAGPEPADTAALSAADPASPTVPAPAVAPGSADPGDPAKTAKPAAPAASTAASAADPAAPPAQPAKPPRRGPGGSWTGRVQVGRDRLWTLVICAALLLLPFLSSSGHIVNDTKLDMPYDPAAFLARAMHLWDPSASFGTLQDQAVGYLFPMGPFFIVLKAIAIPAWVVQRLWMALLLIVAFLGTRRLAAALGLGDGFGRRLGALAYALSPLMLAEVGTVSAGIVPVAMLPWVMLPLVRQVEGTAGPRIGVVRAAALSGLGVLASGGVNAVSTLAPLAVPGVYLLFNGGLGKRWRLLAAWLAAVFMAAFWWLVPLALTGKYGFSFLPYTETASVTSSTTGLTDVLGGQELWTSRLAVDGVIWHGLGFALATGVILQVAYLILAALGLVGAARADNRHRRWMLWCVLLGFALIGAGHASDLTPVLGSQARSVLDGSLAAFRSLYKFDPMVRLPLALGLAHFVAVTGKVRLPGPAAVRRVAVLPAVAVIALGTVGVQTAHLGLTVTHDRADIPRYWKDAAAWIDKNADHHTTLAVPSAEFGEYTWGDPLDEPLQALTDSSWAARNLVPAGSPGNALLLQAVDQRLTDGRGSAGLAQAISRASVRYLLVRNDLDPYRQRGNWPVYVHQALAATPGVHKVAEFGPPVGARPTASGAVPLFGLYQSYPALEIYEVDGAADPIQAQPTSSAVKVLGSPSALIDLADAGMIDANTPVVISGDPNGGASAPALTVDSDSLRDAPTVTARLTDSTAATRLAAQPGPHGPALAEKAWSGSLSAAQLTGVDYYVTASSYGNDAIGQPGQYSTSGTYPYSAIDGDKLTSWISDGMNGVIGQWLRVTLLAPLDPGVITVAFDHDSSLGPAVTAVDVQTEAGTQRDSVDPNAAEVRLAVPSGGTRWIQIRVAAVAGKEIRWDRVGVTEITIPAPAPAPGAQAADRTTPTRTVVLPPAPAGSAILMSRGPDRSACADSPSAGRVCGLPTAGTEDGDAFDRSFVSDGARTTTVTGHAVLMGGLDYAQAVGAPGLDVTATSSWPPDPTTGPAALLDADPNTAWYPDPHDTKPTIDIVWDVPTVVNTLKLVPPRDGVAATATSVRLDTGPGTASVDAQVGADGTVQIPSGFRTATAHLRITPTAFMGNGTTDIAGYPHPVPFGLSEIQMPEVTSSSAGARPADATPLTLGCGGGPELTEDGVVFETKATGTYGDVRHGRPLAFTSCSEVRIANGSNRLVLAPASPYRVLDAALSAAAASPAAPAPRQVTPTAWDTADRTASVGPGDQTYLVLAENYNSGWKATLDGKTLTPARIDGWKQAWVVPAGDGGRVHMSFTPDHTYRMSLLIGLVLVLLLIAGALLPTRRPIARSQVPGAGRTASGRPVWELLIALPLFGLWVAGWAGLLIVLGVLLLAVATARMVRLPSWPVALPLVALATFLAIAHYANQGLRHWHLAEDIVDAPAQGVALALLAYVLAVAALRDPSARPADPPGGSADPRLAGPSQAAGE